MQKVELEDIFRLVQALFYSYGTGQPDVWGVLTQEQRTARVTALTALAKKMKGKSRIRDMRPRDGADTWHGMAFSTRVFTSLKVRWDLNMTESVELMSTVTETRSHTIRLLTHSPFLILLRLSTARLNQRPVITQTEMASSTEAAPFLEIKTLTTPHQYTRTHTQPCYV
jgi:hypothetical protein